MGVSLDLRGVEVAYGSTVALHSLTLSVPPGEFFCLLGPSGCGKTTMLSVIAGFLPMRAGTVILGGRDVTHLPPQRRRIGLVFQNYALYPHMSVAQNVGYGLKVQKHDRAAAAHRVEEMLQLVHLDGKADRYPSQLSGGEQQRVAIARALAIAPDLLLLDEPLSNLDARLRDEMRMELKRIQRQSGVTTVFVTHDQAEAFGIGDRVGLLNRGRLEQIGPPHEIYREPRTPFVAGFIGRSNRLRGRLDGQGPATTFRIGSRAFACAHDGAGLAADVVWFLRPEELRICAHRGTEPSVSGRIVDRTYAGTLVSYRIETAIGVLEVCEFGAAQGTHNPDHVHVNWAADAGHLLQGETDD